MPMIEHSRPGSILFSQVDEIASSTGFKDVTAGMRGQILCFNTVANPTTVTDG
jgi:hypothetical protein